MSFAAGFQLGNRIISEVEESKRQKVLDERAAKEFARKEAEWARTDKLRGQEDAAFDTYNTLQTTGQVVDSNNSGFSNASAQMLYGQGGQAAVDDAASYANVENVRLGLPTSYTTSSAPEAGGPPAPTVRLRKATDLDRISALEGIAVARRDMNAMATLGQQRKVAEDDQFLAKAMKDYTGAEEQIGGTAAYLNSNSRRITMGTPDKDGFVQLSVVRPDGRAEFLNLARQDQARLYAAAQLMERNPTRALEMMSSVNKELASAIAQENGLVGTVATNMNSVADKRGGLGVQRMNAETNRMNAETNAAYRQMMGEAAQQRAAGAAGATGKPVKMDVQTLDPVTGKSTKVQVLMNPATGEARTADGKPFTDSDAIDRAMGRMTAESRIAAAEANDLQLLEAQVKSGNMPFSQLEAERAKVRATYEPQRARLAFSGLDEQEKVAAVRQAVGAGGKPEAVAAALGVTPEYVKNALGGSGRKSSMAPPMATGLPQRKSELQQAYEDWQAAKPGWLQQATPTSRQREAAAEARYTELLRNQYSK